MKIPERSALDWGRGAKVATAEVNRMSYQRELAVGTYGKRTEFGYSLKYLNIVDISVLFYVTFALF